MALKAAALDDDDDDDDDVRKESERQRRRRRRRLSCASLHAFAFTPFRRPVCRRAHETKASSAQGREHCFLQGKREKCCGRVKRNRKATELFCFRQNPLCDSLCFFPRRKEKREGKNETLLSRVLSRLRRLSPSLFLFSI